MITYFKRTVRDKSLRKLDHFELGSWIKVKDPSPKEINYLVEEFNLDERNLKSGLDQNELPRFDQIGDNTYIFTKTIPRINDPQLQTYLIVIGKDFILTFSKEEPNFVYKILEEQIKFVTTQKLKCLINLLMLSNQDFEKSTVGIVKRVQGKRKFGGRLTEGEVSNLIGQEHILNQFVSSYYYIKRLYDRIVKKLDFYEEDQEIIEDLIEESNQGFNLCKSSLKTISNIRSYYMISLSNKLNKVITLLTVVTILISLPTLISGIYGMNVRLPLQADPWAFHYLLGLMGLTCAGFMLYLRKKKII